MAISFTLIPSNVRTPGWYVEYDDTMALSGLLGIQQRLLIIGQRLSTGEVEAGVPTLVVSAEDAARKFGLGSMLAAMCAMAKANNAYTETWAVALNDDDAGVEATGTLTFGGAATAAGTLCLYVGGARLRLAVASGATASEVAAAVAAAINAATDLPATAAAADAVVTVTARHAGTTGNYLDLRHSYYQGEALPKGITLTVAAMSGGSGNPDLDDALDALPDQHYHYVVQPYTDAANLTALETWLDARSNPLVQLPVLAFAAASGTTSAVNTLGDSRNHERSTIMDAGLCPTPPWLVAAAYGAVAAFNLNTDPARPLQTLELVGVLPPALADRRSISERNILLYDGVSTMIVDSDGTCRIERAITTRQENEWGVDDPSWLDVNTIATLDYIQAQIIARMSNRYPRHKLAGDEAQVGAGQAVVRPKDLKQELIALFTTMEKAGIVENLEQFKADLVVERDANDRGRVNALVPPSLVGQFRVFAGKVQYRL